MLHPMTLVVFEASEREDWNWNQLWARIEQRTVPTLEHEQDLFVELNLVSNNEYKLYR